MKGWRSGTNGGNRETNDETEKSGRAKYDLPLELTLIQEDVEKGKESIACTYCCARYEEIGPYCPDDPFRTFN